MSDAIPQELQELSRELAAARKNPWQPRTVCRAFARRSDGLAFTMQTWIDLEAIRSPLLTGGLPEAEDLEATFAAWGMALEWDGKTLADTVLVMQAEIREGFAAALKVKPQEASGGGTDTGCGDWAVLMSFLVVDAGLSLAEALQMRVAQTFVLLATTRLRQGWQLDDTSYALREVANG